MPTTLVAEARLRDRNQITIPDAIARAAGMEPGEMFVVELEPEDPDTLRVRRVRTSYAGALRGLYGDVTTSLAEERASWE